MATKDGTAPDPAPQAVVGWVHRPLPQGIELQVQTTPSAFALGEDRVATTRLVLTRNQALLLASFLLRVTDHSAADVPDDHRPRWGRWFRGRS
ncbi:hypothetical protein M9979_16710 [Sphingomonas sp. RP10(2022)]|uniref:Uncharacterized protein n=1 Tax=Sphingomonas liriopis TaxID=2949094 RepID=A0A9X2KR88_9SPHN|nr:hypothetical protein [Sphingomonas liriopis]MCP3736509.1 hypothetical protein [Sphingomonas liriopis]